MKVSEAFALSALLITNAIAQSTQTGNVEIYEGLVAGVGKGTYAIICFVIFSTILCLFKDCSSSPNRCICFAICIPIVVFLIIRGLPVKSLESDKQQNDKLPTNNFKVKSGLAVALLLFFLLCLCCVVLGSNFSSQLIGRRIDSVSVRELKLKQQKDAERLQK